MMTNNQLSSPKDKLSPRQKTLLFAVIKEYCQTGISLGSNEIKEKYGFNFSSATIRNEFSRLREMGYLYQPFTNASNQPTEKSFKLFVNQLILGLQVTSKQQDKLRKQLEEMQAKQFKLDKEISRLLAIQTGSVGFLVNQQTENVSGISSLINNSGDGTVSDILDFLDNFDKHKQHLLTDSQSSGNQLVKGSKNKKISTFFGVENPVIPLGKGYAMVSTEVYLSGQKDQKSVIGLITPVRLLANKKKLELLDALAKVLQEDESDLENDSQ